MKFDFGKITEADREIAKRYIGSLERAADLVIKYGDGAPYLYRWWVIPRNLEANIYFHIQVASDPERPFHNHPWDNHSVILSGGYDELTQYYPPKGPIVCIPRRKGDTVFRTWEVSHRILLPAAIPYTITQFSTGKLVNEWGFWVGETFYPHAQLVINDGHGNSVFRYPEGVKHEHD